MNKSLMVFLGKVFSAFLSFFIGVVISRLLDSDQVGLFYLHFTNITMLALIAILGCNQIVLKEVASCLTFNDKEQAKKEAASALIKVLVIFTIFIPGYYTFIYNNFPLLNSELGVIVGFLEVIVVLFLIFQNIVVEIFRANFRVGLASIFGGAIYSLFFCLIAYLIIYIDMPLQVADVLFILAISLAAQSLIAFIFARPYLKIPDYYLIKKWILSNNITGLQISLASFFTFALNQSGIWVVGYFLQPKDIAIYASVSKIIMLFSFVSNIFYAIIPPLIIKLIKNNRLTDLESLLRGCASINAITLFIPFLVCLMFPHSLLSFLFGPEYSHGAWILIILSFSAYFNAITGIRGYVLIITDGQFTQMLIAGFCGILSFILACIGAVYIGLDGVALGFGFGVCVQCCVELVAVKRIIGVKTHFKIMSFKQVKHIWSVIND